MAWAKKEKTTYPPLNFTVGKFIRDKVVMNEEQTEVTNTFYYDNCKIEVKYTYSYKSRTFQEEYRTHVEVAPELIKKEIEELEKSEKELAEKNKEMFISDGEEVDAILEEISLINEEDEEDDEIESEVE